MQAEMAPDPAPTHVGVLSGPLTGRLWPYLRYLVSLKPFWNQHHVIDLSPSIGCGRIFIEDWALVFMFLYHC